MKIDMLEGIIVPLVTPFEEDGSLDHNSLAIIIEHVIAGGVNGIFILGTTGEFASMPLSMKQELIESTCKLVAKRTMVMVGISSCNFQETKLLVEYSEIYGADAVVASPPFYYPLSQNEILIYYKEIVQICSLPLYLYNMPSLTKVVIEPETITILASIDGVIGLKDSSSNMNYLEDIFSALSEHKEFQVFIGPEEKLDYALGLGVTGGVNGGANLFPSIYVALYDAFKNGNKSEVSLLQQKIYDISENIYHLGEGPSSYLQGLKAAMSLKGLCKNVLLFPLETLNSNQVNTIGKMLNDLG
jgi:2-dehydro-3-deoxy-D-pentonate aldolase